MPDNISRKIMQRGWRRQGRRARLGLMGGLCTGLILCIFSFWGGREIFMARPLSMNHAGQEKICGNCHHPFEGVSDHRCATTCHTEIYDWSLPVNLRAKEPGIPYKQGIHYNSGNFDKQKDCLKCHPAKCHPRDLEKTKPPEDTAPTVQCEARDVENLRIPEPLTENSCINCHKNCERSTRCFDCHNEHVDGMPITVNDPEDKFQGLTIVLKENFLPGTIPEEIEWAEVKPTPQEYSLPRGKFLEMDWTGDEKIMATFERFRGRMHENNCMG